MAKFPPPPNLNSPLRRQPFHTPATVWCSMCDTRHSLVPPVRRRDTTASSTVPLSLSLSMLTGPLLCLSVQALYSSPARCTLPRPGRLTPTSRAYRTGSGGPWSPWPQSVTGTWRVYTPSSGRAVLWPSAKGQVFCKGGGPFFVRTNFFF